MSRTRRAYGEGGGADRTRHLRPLQEEQIRGSNGVGVRPEPLQLGARAQLPDERHVLIVRIEMAVDDDVVDIQRFEPRERIIMPPDGFLRSFSAMEDLVKQLVAAGLVKPKDGAADAKSVGSQPSKPTR